MVMLLFGRIAGIIGIASRALQAVAVPAQDWYWRIAFIIGLLAAPVAVWLVTGDPIEQSVSGNLPAMAVAGLLVGFGFTRMGNGCTTGHGVCWALAALDAVVVGDGHVHGHRDRHGVRSFATCSEVCGMTLARQQMLVAFVSGLVFTIGTRADLSGMTNPAKVLAFLDMFGGDWDPSLMFVMGGAVAIVTFSRVSAWSGGSRGVRCSTRRLRASLTSSQILICASIGGAALFGIGWGLGGLCPGPALTALPLLAPGTLVFVPAMLIGLWAGQRARDAVAPVTR